MRCPTKDVAMIQIIIENPRMDLLDGVSIGPQESLPKAMYLDLTLLFQAASNTTSRP